MTSFADRARTPRGAQTGAGGSRVHRSSPHVPRPPWAPVQLMERPRSASAGDERGPTPAPNRTGLPDRLKAGVEARSGLAMDDVRVHRNSPEPAKLGALAYTRGSDIHLGPSQEEHLPHEAWHVVQQKQGRVQATTQLKGTAVNADIGLEAEADRMGEAADCRGRSNVRISPSRMSGASQVAQMKIKHGADEDLQTCPENDPCCHSEIVESYIKDPKRYVMRDTCSVLDNEIYLIMQDKLYVFGEEHSKEADKKWNEDAFGWDSVKKLVEEDLIVPGFPDIGQPLYSGIPIILGSLPFDSITARFLTFLILANNDLNAIGETGAARLKNPSSRIIGSFERVAQWFGREYVRWFDRIPGDPAIGGDTNPERKASATVLVDEYCEKFEVLRLSMQKLAVRLNLQDADKPTSELSDPVDKYLVDFNRDRGFVIDLVKDLEALLSMPEKETRAVDRRAAKKKANFNKAVDTTLASRDRAMLASIAAAGPPLLIKTGGAHEDEISNKLGDAVISVPSDLPFARMTKRDEPLKPSTGKK